jgi:nucleolar protein 12
VKVSQIPASNTTSRAAIKESSQPTHKIDDKLEEGKKRDGLVRSGAQDKSDFEGIGNEIAAEGDAYDVQRSRKRRRIQQTEDLESSYMKRLAREEGKEARQRQAVRGAQNGRPRQNSKEQGDIEGLRHDESSASSEDEELTVPKHETVDGLDASATSSKAARTVFLGNVSTLAIKSKSARKVLLNHLASFLHGTQKHDPSSKVESLRFRSTAFASGVGPKKAAFAKKELMDDTTSSTNAYVVYSSEAAARVAAAQLNGTVVLDRHLRADYAVHPSVVDHRRCIFVGNLSFVDKENVENANEAEGGQSRRSKAKQPADAEEGLWRTFSRAGAVESVRVVRDKETRVGKGFAYVQFKNENGVEAALSYNDKKFPPMLPRKLRVMRAKKTKQAAARRGSYAGGRDFQVKGSISKFGVGGDRGPLNARWLGEGRQAGPRKSNSFVFEGHRASGSGGSKSGNLKIKKKRTVKPNTRSSRRGSAFKVAGGKRKQDG